MAKDRTAAQELLNRVAAEMINGKPHARLGSGLELVYQQQGPQRRLALAREKVEPFAPEIEAVRAAFNVPPAAEERRFQKSRRHPKTNRQVVYSVVELTWLHLPTPEQEAAAATAATAATAGTAATDLVGRAAH